MNWHQTIESIRSKKEFEQLVCDTYLHEDLSKNVEAFLKSDELLATLKIFTRYANGKGRLLDVGCGSGFSSICFAKSGYDVVAIEPDTSVSVGSGAIELLKQHYQLANITVHNYFAEEINYPDSSFDIIYARQSMHHAANLPKFISELSRVLKPGGIIFTSRDHVVNDKEQLNVFLANHPLHKFYGGENAFSLLEYSNAFLKAGLLVKKSIGPLDSPINYFPKSSKQVKEEVFLYYKNKFGLDFSKFPFLFNVLFRLFVFKTRNLHDVPGRLYSFVLQKK